MEAPNISNTNNNLSVISFAESKPKLTDANRLILNLLKDACDNKRAICKNDILDLYCLWKFGNRDKIKRSERQGIYSNLLQKWTYTWADKEYTKKEFFNLYTEKPKAITWFKLNLGAVILKGRLVVLPVIDID